MRPAFSLLLMLVGVTTVYAQNAKAPRGIIDKAFGVTARGNTPPAFMIRLSINRDDRAFVDGENLIVNVQSEKDGYLYLYYVQVEDGVEKHYVLYPNDFDASSQIAAGTPLTIPAKNTYDLKCIPPFGPGRLFALVTKRPLKSVKQVATKSGPTETTGAQIREAVQEAQQAGPQDFAEVFLDLMTFPNAAARDAYLKPQRRVAVCIGISDYADPGINDLSVSHHDAEVMADLLRSHCGVTDVALLTNAQATRQAIEQAIFQDLPSRTQAGDTIFIFYSGHGGRCADTNGDEADGFDEYLVPQDGKNGDDNTMILDDVFARWIQQLEGRKICILLDNCHSGGATKTLRVTKGRKGIPSMVVERSIDRLPRIDVFDGELRRSKDLGQQGTQVLAACQANQLAWEMLPPGKTSVFTYYLAEAIAQKSKADKDGDGKLAISEAFQFITPAIKKYVKDNMSTDQDALSIDNGGAIILAP